MKRIKNYLNRQLNCLIDFLSRHRWIVAVGFILFLLVSGFFIAAFILSSVAVLAELPSDISFDWLCDVASVNLSCFLLGVLYVWLLEPVCVFGSLVHRRYLSKRKPKQ